LKNLQVPEEEAASVIPEQPVDETPVEPLPDWLQGIEAVPAASIEPSTPAKAPTEEQELPEWLQEAEFIASEQTGAAAEEGLPEWLQGIVSTTETVEPVETPIEPVAEEMIPAAEIPEEQPAEEVPAIPGVDKSQVFAEAQASLDAGDLDQALPKYAQLIESQAYLEEIIRDLQNALYRSPVDVPLYEILGDAFAQSNRLQDALDTYTKAEELLVKEH
jgi:tetratricopeptide (TPR) repeat protein